MLTYAINSLWLLINENPCIRSAAGMHALRQGGSGPRSETGSLFRSDGTSRKLSDETGWLAGLLRAALFAILFVTTSTGCFDFTRGSMNCRRLRWLLSRSRNKKNLYTNKCDKRNGSQLHQLAEIIVVIIMMGMSIMTLVTTTSNAQLFRRINNTKTYRQHEYNKYTHYKT